MARERLRQGWAIKKYKYHARPIGDLPQELWDLVRASNSVWNRLLEIRETLLADVSDISEKITGADARGDLEESRRLSESRKVRWDQFYQDTLSYIRSPDVTSLLGSEQREWVYTQFHKASKATLKKGGSMRLKKRIDRVTIYHRFTSGGLPVEKIFATRNARFSLQPVDPEAYSNNQVVNRRKRLVRGSYGISPPSSNQLPRAKAKQFAFLVNLHRPLPHDSVLKEVVWTGSFDRLNGWDWSLILTVEFPPPVDSTTLGDQTLMKTAALDLGWRKFDSYLRVGVLGDTDGNFFELRLPLLERRSKRLRRLEVLIRKHQAEMPKDKIITVPTTIHEIWDAQSRCALLLERVKSEAICLLNKCELPENIRAKVSLIPRMRDRGLGELAQTLKQHVGEKEGSPYAPEVIKVITLLESGLNDKNVAQSKINESYLILRRRRNWYYENLARWIASSYDRLIWEGNLDLQAMSEQIAGSPLTKYSAALVNSRKYRAFANLYYLRTAIKQQFAYRRDDLFNEKTKDTTLTCNVCAAKCEKVSALEVLCPNGHKEDQDVRAVKNFLSLQSVTIKNSCKSVNAPRIPKELRSIVTPLE